MSTVSPLTAAEVKTMLDRGVAHSQVVAELVGTGIWSDDGAREIVRFLTAGPDRWLARNRTFDDAYGYVTTR